MRAAQYQVHKDKASYFPAEENSVHSNISQQRIIVIQPRIRTGDRLGSFRDSMLGKLTGQDKADGSLDLTRRDC